MDEEVKVWWQSKTIIASFISLFSLVLYLTGAPLLAPTDSVALLNHILQATTALGTIAAMISRVAATKQVVITKPLD